MQDISWDVGDPIMETLSIAKDAAGFWNVSITLQEATPNSLGSKVVKAKLKSQGKDVAQSMWPVSGSRPETGTAQTTLSFQTGSSTYPTKVKLEIELAEK
jgi:hypothetical protein